MTQARRTLLFFLIATQVTFAAVCVYVYRALPQGLISSDGKSYYAWLTSVALDHDLDFTNDFDLIYSPGPKPTAPITSRGLVANKTSVGLAIVEAPGFAVGHLIAVVSGQTRNGWSAPYQFGTALWLQAIYLTALFLLWVGLVRLGSDPWIATIVVASALVATNLLQYVARPAMAHGAGLSTLCFAFFISVTDREGLQKWKALLLGALIGLALIIRTSNLLWVPLLLPFMLPAIGRSPGKWSVFLGGFLVPLAIQIAFASAQWGKLTFSSYGDEGFTAGLTGMVGTLFSARHGLFVYHPWYLLMLGLTVLAAVRREMRVVAVGALISFTGFWIANGTWWSWWFGDGFGNRSFVETIPVLLVPAVLWLSAALRERGTRVMHVVLGMAGVLAAVNLVLWSGFVLRRFPPDGTHTIAQAYLWWR